MHGGDAGMLEARQRPAFRRKPGHGFTRRCGILQQFDGHLPLHRFRLPRPVNHPEAAFARHFQQDMPRHLRQGRLRQFVLRRQGEQRSRTRQQAARTVPRRPGHRTVVPQVGQVRTGVLMS